MTVKRSPLPPALVTALSVVVLLQSTVLLWVVLAAPSDRDSVVRAIRMAPGVETVVEACEAALS